MADIKCPLCGSMDVEVELKQGVDTYYNLSNVGYRIGSPFGRIGRFIGSIFGTVAKSLIEKDYYKCHCWKCDHNWKMRVGSTSSFTLRDLFDEIRSWI